MAENSGGQGTSGGKGNMDVEMLMTPLSTKPSRHKIRLTRLVSP